MFDKLKEVSERVRTDLYMFDGPTVMRAVKWLSEGHTPQAVAQKINDYMDCLGMPSAPAVCTCGDEAHTAHIARVNEIEALVKQAKVEEAGKLAKEFVKSPDYADPLNADMYIDMAALVCILRAPADKMKDGLMGIMVMGARLLREDSPAMRRIVRTIQGAF